MGAIPGSVPLTGKVAPTDTTDTFATHMDIYGEGGYMTVADVTEREAITTERRKQGMAVFQNDTNELYILQDGVTNADWVLFSGGGGSGDMQDVYDNSTPNVEASDTSKSLVLLNGEVTIATSVAGGLTGTMDLSGEEGVQISSSASNISLQAPAGDFSISCFNHGQLSSNDTLTLTTNNGLLNVVTANGDINIETQGTGLTNNITIQADSSSGGTGGDIILPGTGNTGTPSTGDVLTAHSASGELRWTSSSSLAGDLQTTLTQGSQFQPVLPYSGGFLDINYSQGNPSDPTSNDTGIRLDADSTGSGSGENLMISSSGSADSGFIKLHAQNVSSFPTVSLTQLIVGDGNMYIDTTSSDFSDAAVGDVVVAKAVSASTVGATGKNIRLGTAPGVQVAIIELDDADIQALDVTPIQVIANPGAGYFIHVLNSMAYLNVGFVNTVNLNLQFTGCNNGGGVTNWAINNWTGMTDNTGAYFKPLNPLESFGANCDLEVILSGASGLSLMPGAGSTSRLWVSYMIVPQS